MSTAFPSLGVAARVLDHVDGPSFLLQTGTDRILDCNERGAQFLGYAPTELRGRSISDVHPEETDVLHEAAIQAGRQAVSRRDGLQCRTKGGERIDADVSLLAVPDGGPETAVESDATPDDTGTTPDTHDGSATTVVAVVHTDRDESRHARQIAGLLCILRHTVRNRLNVVLGRLEQIRHEGDGETAAHADRAVAACEELLATTGDAWEVREALREPPGYDDTVDAVTVVESAVETVSTAWPTAEIETRLPSSAAVVGTASLELAVRHTVENAVEHDDTDPPRAWVVVRPPPAVDGECVEVVVADHGPGIPADERRVVRRETPPTPLAHASGLGLWITGWVVRQSRGSLDVDTGPDGTVVTLRLPAVGDSRRAPHGERRGDEGQ